MNTFTQRDPSRFKHVLAEIKLEQAEVESITFKRKSGDETRKTRESRKNRRERKATRKTTRERERLKEGRGEDR